MSQSVWFGLFAKEKKLIVRMCFVQKWNTLYHEASTSIDDRESKLEEVANMIEIELTLLGATAVEDKLQDKVKETCFLEMSMAARYL